MGWYVCYVVAAGANEVLARLPPEDRQAYEPLPEAAREGLLECCHWSGTESVYIQLDRCVSQFTLPQIKYSWIVNKSPKHVARVEAFDGAIGVRFHGLPVVRVDQFLLETWEATAGEGWRDDPGGFTAFQLWLYGQDSQHWAVIDCRGTSDWYR